MSARPPDISVIIPTYNRSRVLGMCLDALFAQTVDPARFEIIVSDDGSHDDTREQVARHAARAPVEVIYHHQPNAGGNAARNRAIERARGALLLIINDDSIATPTLLAEHLRAHEEHAAAHCAVLGRVTISPEVAPSLFAALHLDATFQSFAARRELDWPAFITCNLSVKKAFLTTHGMFGEYMRLPMHDDLELGERLSHHGLRVFYVPEALCYHYHHLSEDDFLRQATRDGRELARWYQRDPALLPQLRSLGLSGRRPLPRPFRHMMVDAAINRGTYPLVLRAARALSASNAAAALFLYRRVFQHLKRRAIDEMLRR